MFAARTTAPKDAATGAALPASPRSGNAVQPTLTLGSKTGHYALLRSPWPKDLDERQLDRLRQQSWWNGAAGQHVMGGEADLGDVDRWLLGEELQGPRSHRGGGAPVRRVGG